jgi:Tol biopolymer transport system component/DNA-binding winged helix-turn-helix (wHTH) protein
MPSPSDYRTVYRFGQFEVYPGSGEVRKRGIPIRVQDQPLRLLTALLERPGEVIAREELHRKLWPDDTFVDFEHGLNAAATRLRQALGDSAQTPRFIESVPRRGYRFIGHVEEENGGSDQSRDPVPSPEGCVTPPDAPNGKNGITTAAETSRTRTTSRRVILPWIVSALLFVSTATVSLLHFRERARDDRPVKFSLAAPENTRFAEFDSLALSPDGRLLALTSTNTSGETHLWVRPLNALAATRLEGTAGASFPFWSADSSTIAYFANGKLKRINAVGGSPKIICDAPTGRGGSWNQNGIIVYAPSVSSPLFQVASGGGEPKPLKNLGASREELSHRWPHFLPGGRHFLYSVTSAQPEMSGIYVGAIDSGRATLLRKNGTNAAYVPARNGIGHLLFVQGGTLNRQRFDPDSLQLSGDPVPLIEGVDASQHIEPLRASFSTSHTGVLTYQSARGTDRLTWVDRSGTRLATIGDPGTHLHPSLSPDEKEVAVDRMDPLLGTFDIWRIDAKKGTSSRLTFDSTNETAPVWSPDGSRIALSSKRSLDLFEKASSGAGTEKLLFRSGQWKFATDWSPDGNSLLYYEFNAKLRNRDLWMLPMVGDLGPRPLLDTEFNESDGVFSPDGKAFAYSSDQSGKQEVYVQPFPPAVGTGKWMVSANGGSRPKWPRGKELFYLAPDGTMMAVDVTVVGGFRAGVPRPLFKSGIIHDFRVQFAVTANGRSFLIPIATSPTGSPDATVVVNWMSDLEH